MLNRNKNSIYNAISAVGMTFVNGLLAIVVTRMLIGEYGSDFNGVNSTANQLVNVLLIVEGGFTLASNVALFSPLTNLDYKKVNAILSKTRRKFRWIGILFLSLGVIASILFTIFANSELEKELIFFVIVMAMVPAAFNLYYATTYRVLLQAQQKEYVINFITMITLGAGHIGNIVLVLCHGPMWLVRTITMFCAVINSIMIAWYVKQKNRFLNLDGGINDEAINGTKDVMIQKITGMFYYSAPIIFLAISPAGGTILASVYAVYNNIFNMIKSLLRSIIDAPRLGLGQMLSESDKESVWSVFVEYQYIVFAGLFVVITTAYVLIMPFVSIYTRGINDANYYDEKIAILMTLITVFELIHIPSGHLINMAGEFKVSKDIQVVSLIILLACMFSMGGVWGIHGLLIAVLLVAILLAVLEIGFIHKRFFENKVLQFMRLSLPLLIIGLITCMIESSIFKNINGISSFIINGIVITLINSILMIFISVTFNLKTSKKIFNRMQRVIKK